MTNQEKVSEKIKELNAAIQEAGGSVLVIGIMDDGINNEKTFIISSIHGKSKQLIEAVAKLLANNAAEPISAILKSGADYATLLRLTGYDPEDAETEVTNNSSNQ